MKWRDEECRALGAYRSRWEIKNKELGTYAMRTGA